MIPRHKKFGKEGKRQESLSLDLLVKLKGKKCVHRQRKQGQVTWEEYRDAVQLYRDGGEGQGEAGAGLGKRCKE